MKPRDRSIREKITARKSRNGKKPCVWSCGAILTNQSKWNIASVMRCLLRTQLHRSLHTRTWGARTRGARARAQKLLTTHTENTDTESMEHAHIHRIRHTHCSKCKTQVLNGCLSQAAVNGNSKGGISEETCDRSSGARSDSLDCKDH